MANNRFGNDDFEDIFSNSPKIEEFEDISSFSSELNFEEQENDTYSDGFSTENFSVRYNSAVRNRKSQEIQYNNIEDVYGDISSSGNSKNPQKPKKNKKRHYIRNAVLVLLAVVIVVTSCIGFYGYSTVQKLLGSFNTDEPLGENQYIDSAELYSDEEQINILLVGTDARNTDEASRSDTMMLVTLDNKNKQIKLTSFLRDSYVSVAGRKHKEKLNASYFRGGIQGLTDTLELNFKVDINYYVLVDFEIFTTLVDELGGVEINITERESAYSKKTDTDHGYIPLEAGDNVLVNGQEALWYSRMRYLDSDFMRTQRQRKVISAIVGKARQQKLPQLISLAEKVIPLVKTNLSSDELMDFGIDALLNKAYEYEIVQHQVPADKTWSSKRISGVGDCLVMNIDENVQLLHSFLKDKQITENPQDTSEKK